ncbi:hypothetical protein SLA2020_325670 [Shorea laevis]
MAEEKHHHHHLHHKEEPSETSVFSETAVYSETACPPEVDYKKEENHHKNLEHLAELGAAAAGIYAVHEKHKAKKDPEHAQRHKIEEGVAAALAVGAGGFAFHRAP